MFCVLETTWVFPFPLQMNPLMVSWNNYLAFRFVVLIEYTDVVLFLSSQLVKIIKKFAFLFVIFFVQKPKTHLVYNCIP